MNCEHKALGLSRRISTTGLFLMASAALFSACASPNGDEDAPGPEAAVAGDAPVAPASSTTEAEAPDEEFVITPVGRFHQSCVHDVGDGAEIDAEGSVRGPGGGMVRHAPCGYKPRDDRRAKGVAPVTNGWAEYDGTTTNTNSDGYNWINELDGTWTVPAAPTQYTGQTIFLFTAAEPFSGNAIVQPVLQYGPSSAGGGGYWTEAVWYISSAGNVYHSTLRSINVGDTVHGYMSGQNCTSDGKCSWQMSIWDGYIGSYMTIATNETFRWGLKGVLEVYGVTNCNKLPASGGMTFSNVHVYMPGPGVDDRNDVTTSQFWASYAPATGCSFGVTDAANSTTLYWN